MKPFLANLFLYSYEFHWLNEKLKKQDWKTLNKFKRTSRYIDDLFTINNDDYLNKYQGEIYPPELKLTSEIKDNQKVNLKLKTTHSIIHYMINVINFPFQSSTFQIYLETFHQLNLMVSLQLN